MKTNKRGSNQYVAIHRFTLTDRNQKSILILLVICFLGIIINFLTQPDVISPISDNPVFTQVEAKEPENPEIEDVVAYIAKVFKPEGTGVIVRAINCFASESGLRHNAEGWNPPYEDKNGVYHEATFDWGVAQLNNKWQRVTKEEAFNYKKNIDRAYKLYKSHGDKFAIAEGGAWYGKGCK